MEEYHIESFELVNGEEYGSYSNASSIVIIENTVTSNKRSYLTSILFSDFSLKVNSNTMRVNMESIGTNTHPFFRKEHFYITAIKNLRKRINFIELNNEYQNGDITDQEFEKELEENHNKYFINISLLKSQNDLEILNDIVEKVNDDLTIDDVSDIFSIDITTIPSTLSL